MSEYERAEGGLSPDDCAFLLSEIRTRFLGPVHAEGSRDVVLCLLAVRCEVVFKLCKVLCKHKLWAGAAQLVDAALEGIRKHSQVLHLTLGLAMQAVKLHRSFNSEGDCSKSYTDCARAIRGLPGDLGETESHAVLEVCKLIIWATESGQTEGMDGNMLLASFSFLEEYQELMIKQQNVSLHVGGFIYFLFIFSFCF